MSTAWHETMEMLAEAPLASAWAFGSYRKGMGGATTHYRERYPCGAIKRELYALGHTDIKLENDYIGDIADGAIREFQTGHGFTPDGKAGPTTCRALFSSRVFDAEDDYGIPRHWLASHGYWESGGYDPGAELVNADGSRDRGLFQDNDQHGPYEFSDKQAFDPAVSVPKRAAAMAKFAVSRLHEFCQIDDGGKTRRFWAWPISVSSFRTPVGAGELAKLGESEVVEPRRIFDSPNYPDNLDTADWESAAAYYVLRIDGVRREYFP